MDDLSIVRTVTLASALERKVERLIVTGELEPGARLIENQLASLFGTSRGPLREALRSLAAKGFVESVRNRGFFVRRLSIAEAKEIYLVREVLFGLAGRLAAGKMTEEGLSSLNELMKQMDEASQAEDVDSYYGLNLEFHDGILAIADNQTLTEDYKRLVVRMHLFRVKGLVLGGGLAVSNEEHRVMYNALEARDPDRAEAAHREHVRRGQNRVITAHAALPPHTKS